MNGTEEPSVVAALLALALGLLVFATILASLFFTLVSDDVGRGLLAGAFAFVGTVALHVFMKAWDMPRERRNK